MEAPSMLQAHTNAMARDLAGGLAAPKWPEEMTGRFPRPWRMVEHAASFIVRTRWGKVNGEIVDDERGPNEQRQTAPHPHMATFDPASSRPRTSASTKCRFFT